ncbi:Nudix hydrolase 12 [Citrus sinensis]|nr:Nudix hydrolase 12 [Citrus sinensis]
MSVEARTGRLRQRYDNNFRLVSGCIPYRLTKDAEDENEDTQTRIEVLMVSSPNRSDLVFPKGGWENDETVMEAACREALEEAGVRGKLNLNIQDAFQLCRYEWMREALEKFMKVMSEERKVEITEEIVEPLPKPVPDVIAECQIVSSNYCVTTTSSQHHGISAIIPFHWQILKRLPLT